MGTVTSRVIGNLKGRVGSMIFGKWRNLYTAKGLYRKRRKKDLVVLPQQLRVKILTGVLMWFRAAIQIGFQKRKNKNPAWQLALAHNLKYAMVGDGPDCEVNFKKIKISDGNLEGAWAAKSQAEPGCIIKISWQMSAMSVGTSTAKDRTYLMMYSNDPEETHATFEIGTRDQLSYSYRESLGNVGQVWHAWIFFISPDGKNVSNSDYCGRAVMIA